MFQSGPYEGLPFMSRSRLRSFLARFEPVTTAAEAESAAARPGAAADHPAASGPDLSMRGFLESYFRAQEESYHSLLYFVGQASDNLEYWLDWTTPPLRHRPAWLNRLSRRLAAEHLAVLGRRPQVRAPGRTAQRFNALHTDLCRLVAFIQISSFGLLTAAEEKEDSFEYMQCALQHLDWQAKACHEVADAIESPVSRPPSSGSLLEFKRRLSEERLLQADIRAADPQGAHVGLVISTDDVAIEQELVKSGRPRLVASQLATQRLTSALHSYMWRTGRPSHGQKYAPAYSIVCAGMLVWGLVRLRERHARTAFGQYLCEVWKQFYHEWVFDPLYEFAGQLFRRLSGEDLLNVQLQELKVEQEALERMLRQFEKVVKSDPLLVESLRLRDATVVSGDDLAERYFERSMSHPMYNVMHGHLLESCMVQTQRMKVLLYASLYSIDAVILQLKWDFLMAGVMPLISLCGLGYWIVSNFRWSRRKERNQRMIRALAEVDRFFNHHAAAVSPRPACSGPVHLGLLGFMDSRDVALSNLAATPPCKRDGQTLQGSARYRSGTERLQSALDGDQATELERIGAALGHLDALCRLASRVGLQATDWRCFRRDVLDLTSPELSSHQKLHVVAAMRSTYHVFQASA